MAIPFLGRLTGKQPTPAFGAAPALPTEQLLGHTLPAVDPGMVQPRVGAIPFGASGRANFYGLPQPDELNPDLIGTRGLMVLDDMYRTDAHIRRLVLAAWSPIVAGTWTLEPYGGEDATDADREIADTIWWMLNEWMSPNFTEHLYTLGPLLLRFGFAPFEQMWADCEHNGKKLIGPRKLDARMPKTVWRWWQDDFAELTHIAQILPNKADVIIPASELTYYRLGAEGDNWMGTSMLRHAYKHWTIKDRLERIDMVGQERKAVGVPVVYHSPEVPASVLDKVEVALAQMHISEVTYLMVPGWKMGSAPADADPANQWLVDIVKFDSSSGDGIRKSIEYHQTAIAASFLTDFLELGHHQVGARATADIQQDPFITAINGALLPPVLPPLNKLIDRIRKRNWATSDGSPQLRLTLHDEASLSEIAAYVVPLVTANAMQTDPDLEDWLRERAGMPPANPEVRAENEKARQDGLDAAAKLAETGEAPGEEPPSPNAPVGGNPAQKPAAGSAAGGAAKPADGGASTGDVGKRSPKPGQQQKTLDAAPPPPNLRVSDSDETEAPEHECGTCVMFNADTGRCWGYGNFVTRDEWVCDSWELSANWKAQDAEADAAGDADDGEPRTLDAAAPVAAGVIVHAADTGRVLVVQRTPDDRDAADVFGRFEFPGGKLDPADASVRGGAVREWQEEVGSPLPEGVQAGDFASPDGRYRAFVYRIPREQDVGLGRADRQEVAGTEWRDPGSLAGGTMSDRAQALLPGLERVLNKWAETPSTEALNALATVTLDDATQEPTVAWWERLLSQDRLREALDGARDHIEAACTPAVLGAARKQAYQAGEGTPVHQAEPPADLVDALTGHYADMYALGHGTVVEELARQRAALGKQLDEPTLTPGQERAAALAGSRLARARKRGEHSARNIVNAVSERLGRAQISGLLKPADLQTAAETAAQGQLRMEALANTSAMINDGRNDAATTAGDVIGAYYSSVLDDRSCEECVRADDGQLLAPLDAVALGPPNPLCAGQDRCRCMLVWVLSSDPAALQAAF